MNVFGGGCHMRQSVQEWNSKVYGIQPLKSLK